MLPQPKVLARLLGAAAPACLMAACVTVGPDFATPAAAVAEHWTAAADDSVCSDSSRAARRYSVWKFQSPLDRLEARLAA
jgi:hypothetical protein